MCVCVCSPDQEVAVTETVTFQIKFERSNACVNAIVANRLIWPNKISFLVLFCPPRSANSQKTIFSQAEPLQKHAEARPV